MKTLHLKYDGRITHSDINKFLDDYDCYDSSLFIGKTCKGGNFMWHIEVSLPQHLVLLFLMTFNAEMCGCDD